MKAKILIIDDEEGIRYTFRTFLTNAGYEVLAAESFSRAQEIIGGTLPDIIFSDIILGDETGLDLLRWVGETGLECPVIMITGQPSIDSAAEAVRLGAFDYLLKPIKKETLLQFTRTALKHKLLMDEKRRMREEKDRYREKLEAIFRSVTDAVITVDEDLTVIEVNPAVSPLFGIAPESLMGRDAEEVENQGIRACVPTLRATLKEMVPIRKRRIETVLPGGARRLMDLSTAPLLNREKILIGATLVARDVTKITELEHRLENQYRFSGVIGGSRRMQALFKLIRLLADTDATVLITGESGTGKSLVAKTLHHHSARNEHKMMTVNCSSLSEHLLESELFGHVKGAFTGAVSDKPGRFEVCDRGSIFLDEIGDVSQRIQLKLLRVLQDREFEKVGDTSPVSVDVRVISATNRNLKEDVAKGRFREDLYYRLKVVEVEVPPLRERAEDIPLLVKHFCAQFAKKYNRSFIEPTESVKNLFMTYPWPGNVRELEHAVEHSFVLCGDNPITPDHVPPEIREYLTHGGESVPEDAQELEAGRIRAALERTDGNKAKTARLLGISRQTLYRKLRRHGLNDYTGAKVMPLK